MHFQNLFLFVLFLVFVLVKSFDYTVFKFGFFCQNGIDLFTIIAYLWF